MKAFLSAGWTNLLVATYEADKTLLQKFLPRKTELDEWNGLALVSVVGFMFTDISICGIRMPFFRSFPEINLRVYTRCRVEGEWQSGVVFIREVSPSKFIGVAARALYKENFISASIRYEQNFNTSKHNSPPGEFPGFLDTCYRWKGKKEWSSLKVCSSGDPRLIPDNTIESFIAKRYIACTKYEEESTLFFQIEHLPWKIFPTISFDHSLDGNSFKVAGLIDVFQQKPVSTFLMDGSVTHVSKPRLLKE